VTIANVKIWDDKYGIQQSKLKVQHSKTMRLLLNLVATVDATTRVARRLEQNLAVLVIILYITNVGVMKNLIMRHLNFFCIEDFVQEPVLSYLPSFIHFIQFHQAITMSNKPVGCRISHNTIYHTLIHKDLTHK
jgi:hypothetical protein